MRNGPSMLRIPLDREERKALMRARYMGDSCPVDPTLLGFALLCRTPVVAGMVSEMAEHVKTCDNWYCQAVAKRETVKLWDVWIHELLRINGGSDYYTFAAEVEQAMEVLARE